MHSEIIKDRKVQTLLFPELECPLLLPGDYLRRDEFLRRWEALPKLKFAELIDNIVYMPPRRGRDHGVMEQQVAMLAGVYRASTPACEAASCATWLMGDDVTQPDTSLWIEPEYGGQSGMEGPLLKGAPEWLAEVCLTDAAYDLHQKLRVYQQAGVREYLAVIVHEPETRWYRLVAGRFEMLPHAPDDVYRSSVFPGFWVDAAALVANQTARVLAVLQQGLASPEHQAFVEQLAARRAGS